MKKNKMMRVASALLVAVLMTTSVISGTFAKYVTTDSASDTARVAKWGVKLQVEGNLYGEQYGTDDAIVVNTDDSISVQVKQDGNKEDVVAPGTENTNGFTISLKGTPEVDGKITTNMVVQNIFLKGNETYGVMIPVDSGVVTKGNFSEFTGRLYYLHNDGKTFKPASEWADTTTYYTLEDEVTTAAEDYYPIIYTLSGATSYDAGTISADSLKAVADGIAAKLNLTTTGSFGKNATWKYTGNVTFNSNQDLDDMFDCNDLKLTWNWTFDQSKNAEDTILANLMAGVSTVVVKDGADYKTLSIGTEAENAELTAGTDDLVYVAGDTANPVACLNTRFSIEITVEQVDD